LLSWFKGKIPDIGASLLYFLLKEPNQAVFYLEVDQCEGTAKILRQEVWKSVEIVTAGLGRP